MSAIAGHRASEGLFATFRDTSPAVDPDVTSDARVESVFEGLIFEGEMPPIPEPLDPPAE